MTILETIFMWSGGIMLILLCGLISCFALYGIYHYLQKELVGFFKITFLYLKSQIYYKDRELIMTAPNGDKYKVVKVGEKKQTEVNKEARR